MSLSVAVWLTDHLCQSHPGSIMTLEALPPILLDEPSVAVAGSSNHEASQPLWPLMLKEMGGWVGGCIDYIWFWGGLGCQIAKGSVVWISLPPSLLFCHWAVNVKSVLIGWAPPSLAAASIGVGQCEWMGLNALQVLPVLLLVCGRLGSL